ncbi:MAG: hypothetical protein ACREFS_02645 [Acetobacteraceae bacterium]
MTSQWRTAKDKDYRVTHPDELVPAFQQVRALVAEHWVPVVVEAILERESKISMGTEIDAITEFEDLALTGQDAPTAIAPLD